MIRRVVRCSAVLALVAAVSLLTPAGAAAQGVWGPGITFTDGVVCNGADAQTALVSWPGPSGPAFALYAVSGPAGGVRGPTTIPAVGGTSAPLPAGGAGLSQGQIGAIAYLIQHHGSDRSDIVADVAARIVGQVAGNVYVTDCLDRHVGGTSPDVAAQLWNEAVSQAGPYHVSVTGPADGATPGQATPVVARVTSAAGAPVSGIAVSFATSSGSVSVASALTDASGQAQVAVTAPGATVVTASVSGVSDLIQTTGGSAVPLVSPGAATVQSGTLDLASSLTADPGLGLSVGRSITPEATTVRTTLKVTGMRGHKGTLTLGAYGPLAYSARTGCRGHTAGEWATARSTRAADPTRAVVTGDGSFDFDAADAPKAGCYQLAANLTTTNATPNVSRSDVGPVVTVAPISISATPTGHGLAAGGDLASTLDVRARDGTSFRHVSAVLVGPRKATDGGCPSTGWVDARAAAATTDVSDDRVTSSGVRAAGCYGFRISGQLIAAGARPTALTIEPGTGNGPLLLISPKISLGALSATNVNTGGTVQATVMVTGTQAQPGALRLLLLRLPYTSRGCVGLDWSSAAGVPDDDSPTTSVSGDGTYRVRSPDVTAKACWTVVPVFTATSNPAVRVTGVADPSFGFLSTSTPAGSGPRDQGSGEHSETLRVVLTAAVAAVVLALVVGGIVIFARRSRNAPA